jgi:Asp-tRNA(Asn)/Glu-tRNA(Gln) amidotransferase A subunit family amidase
MNYEQEISALRAETLAVETVMSEVLARISQLDPMLATAIRAGIDDAANKIVALAAKSDASRDRSTNALDVVDTLRKSMVSVQTNT